MRRRGAVDRPEQPHRRRRYRTSARCAALCTVSFSLFPTTAILLCLFIAFRKLLNVSLSAFSLDDSLVFLSRYFSTFLSWHSLAPHRAISLVTAHRTRSVPTLRRQARLRVPSHPVAALLPEGGPHHVRVQLRQRAVLHVREQLPGLHTAHAPSTPPTKRRAAASPPPQHRPRTRMPRS